MDGSPAQRTTLAAFLGIVVMGGLNGLAVRYSNQELDPFWGAALRFGLAAVLLWVWVLARGLPLPRGGALLGSVLYGLTGFGISYALAYYGLVETPAGVGMVILSLVPLLTLVLAALVGLEKLSLQALAGSIVAFGGAALLFGERITGAGTQAIPAASLMAILGAAVAIAASGVIVKRLPRAHPVVNNALAMATGALMLLGVALVAGDRLVAPGQTSTLLAVGYLVVLGSVALFMLFLHVIERWTASATSYSLLLMPIVAVVAGALMLGEPVTPALLLGGGLMVLGVYLGALAPSISIVRTADAHSASRPVPSAEEAATSTPEKREAHPADPV